MPEAESQQANLLFDRPAATNADLLFGADFVPPRADLTLWAALPLPTLAARFIPPTRAELLAQLPLLTVSTLVLRPSVPLAVGGNTAARLRITGADIRVITPKPRRTRGAPFGPGVQWLGLEDRFALYGAGISFIGADEVQAATPVADPTKPVHGPFSAHFRWVTLPDGDGAPIRLTDGQAKVFEALWTFKGVAVTAERVMQRAGLDSDKPIDVFKVKTRNKGKPEAEGPLAAYRALVKTQQRQGLYWMPCAARSSAAVAGDPCRVAE